jgi:hypothetical protein
MGIARPLSFPLLVVSSLLSVASFGSEVLAQQELSGMVEYHMLVTGTPLFNAPMDLVLGARELHSECWALDVTLAPPVGSAFRRTVDHAAR